MLLRRGGFDFHGAPPAIQRGWVEAGTTVASPGEAVVVDRGLSHFDGPEPVAARMVSVAVAIIAASLCLAFFSQSDPIQPWRTSAAAYTYNCPYGVEMPLTTLENTVLRYIAIRDFRKLPYIVWRTSTTSPVPECPYFCNPARNLYPHLHGNMNTDIFLYHSGACPIRRFLYFHTRVYHVAVQHPPRHAYHGLQDCYCHVHLLLRFYKGKHLWRVSATRSSLLFCPYTC